MMRKQARPAPHHANRRSKCAGACRCSGCHSSTRASAGGLAKASLLCVSCLFHHAPLAGVLSPFLSSTILFADACMHPFRRRLHTPILHPSLPIPSTGQGPCSENSATRVKFHRLPSPPTPRPRGHSGGTNIHSPAVSHPVNKGIPARLHHDPCKSQGKLSKQPQSW